MPESQRHFKKRCENRAGVPWYKIPWGTGEDVIGGTILCRRKDQYLVTHGWPDTVDEDNVEIWDAVPGNFRRVNLAGGQAARVMGPVEVIPVEVIRKGNFEEEWE